MRFCKAFSSRCIWLKLRCTAATSAVMSMPLIPATRPAWLYCFLAAPNRFSRPFSSCSSAEAVNDGTNESSPLVA